MLLDQQKNAISLLFLFEMFKKTKTTHKLQKKIKRKKLKLNWVLLSYNNKLTGIIINKIYCTNITNNKKKE